MNDKVVLRKHVTTELAILSLPSIFKVKKEEYVVNLNPTGTSELISLPVEISGVSG